MGTPTQIDRSAPVLAHHEIDIDAPLDVVWDLHTDLGAWPIWNPDITSVDVHDAFAPGGAFTWTSYGFTVTSTIYDVVYRARVLWGGAANGITGIHEWLFEPTPTHVHVTTNESFAGAPVDEDAAGMQTLLDNSLVAWLGHLKAAAESIH